MRLDKFLSNLGFGSRTQVTKLIKEWYFWINWENITKKDISINFWDVVNIWEDDEIEYKENVYIIMNKPTDYVSSKRPELNYASYLDLLAECPYLQVVDIVGRLDVDTTWLLLLTNNWPLTHNIISPKKDIFKKYAVTLRDSITDNDIKKLETWVNIDEYVTKPAKVEKLEDQKINLSISEWKFHQVKKMLEAVWNEVVWLHRVSIWWLVLDDDLDLWEWRYLKEDEVMKVFE